MKNFVPKYSFTAFHRGGLKECLMTEEPIKLSMALSLIRHGYYEFYAYDDRIKANRYILNDFPNSLGFPTWIHLYSDLPNHHNDGNNLIWHS